MGRERIRKFTEENKDLARNLKKELDAVRKPAASKAVGNNKRKAGSDNSSRDSEERQASVPATGRGKRGKDYDLDKVSNGDFLYFTSGCPEKDYGGRRENSKKLKPYSETPKHNRRTRTTVPCHDFDSSSPVSSELPLRPITRLHKEPIEKRRRRLLNDAEIRARLSVDELLEFAPPEDPEPEVNGKGAIISKNWDTKGQKDASQLDRLHAKFRKVVNGLESGNEAKRLFYKGQDPGRKMMIAGISKEPSSFTDDRSHCNEQSYVFFAARLHSTSSPSVTPSSRPQPRMRETRGGIKLAIADTKDQSNFQDYSNVDIQEEFFYNRNEIRLPLPDHIKSILVDDWENVTKNLQLVHLPSRNPANKIIDTYWEEEKAKRREGAADYDLLEETMVGFKEYFNMALGRVLLYKFERLQYKEIYETLENPAGTEYEGKTIGDIYGGEHLLRLLGMSHSYNIEILGFSFVHYQSQINLHFNHTLPCSASFV